jgi:hypothetical protein
MEGRRRPRRKSGKVTKLTGKDFKKLIIERRYLDKN